MSMFENKTKPELERGNFIAYADEPNTIVDNAGGGGGGGGGSSICQLPYDYNLISDDADKKAEQAAAFKEGIDNGCTVFVMPTELYGIKFDHYLNLFGCDDAGNGRNYRLFYFEMKSAGVDAWQLYIEQYYVNYDTGGFGIKTGKTAQLS